MERLKDRVAIVTGAAQGLGRAYARAMATEGAKVVVADINEAKSASVVEEIRQAGGTAVAVRVDVTDEAQVEAMTARALSEFGGRIDILVNNAAILATLKQKPFWEISAAEWAEVMDVNITGTFLCAKSVSRVMRQQKSGKIVNISSGIAINGRPGMVHYGASKAAVRGITSGMAVELGPYNINVNTVMPGPVVTEVQRATMDEEKAQAFMGAQSLKRLIKPSDLVGIVLFLSSDECGIITGQTVAVNGGSTKL